MTRRSTITFARRAAVSLMLGVLLTFASAWCIAMFIAPVVGANSLPSGIGDGWSYWVGRDFGTVVIKRVRAHFAMQEPLKHDYLVVRTRAVPFWSAVYRPPRDDEVAGVMHVEIARGWPLISLRSHTLIASDAAGNTSIDVRDGLALRSGADASQRDVVLPLRPIWPLFALNVLICGVLAFALVFGPGIARRAIRRRLGHCQRCGYNLKGVTKKTVCPECGTSAVKLGDGLQK